MLDRSQYPQFQTMSNYGMPQAPQSMLGGTGWAPSQDFSFAKRPDALSAGVPEMSLTDNLTSPSFWFGGKNAEGMQTNGAAGSLLGAASGLFSGYMGMKQFGLSKDIFNENKKQFAMNWDANKKLTNGRLEDRQKARNASGSGYESVDSYMKKNGVA